jgi:hypothetical protein
MKKLLLLIGLVVFLTPSLASANEKLEGNIFCEVNKLEAKFIEFRFDWNKTYNEGSLLYLYSRRDNGVKQSPKGYVAVPRYIYVKGGEVVIFIIDRKTKDVRYLFDTESHLYPGKEFIDGKNCSTYDESIEGKRKIYQMFDKYK